MSRAAIMGGVEFLLGNERNRNANGRPFCLPFGAWGAIIDY
jgi:hypothetical protein